MSASSILSSALSWIVEHSDIVLAGAVLFLFAVIYALTWVLTDVD